MTDHTQLRKLATEALHWDFHCDEPACSCLEAWKSYADAANPQAVIELMDEIERLRKDAERLDFLDKDGLTRVLFLINSWYVRAEWSTQLRKVKNLRIGIDAAMKGNL